MFWEAILLEQIETGLDFLTILVYTIGLVANIFYSICRQQNRKLAAHVQTFSLLSRPSTTRS